MPDIRFVIPPPLTPEQREKWDEWFWSDGDVPMPAWAEERVIEDGKPLPTGWREWRPDTKE